MFQTTNQVSILFYIILETLCVSGSLWSFSLSERCPTVQLYYVRLNSWMFIVDITNRLNSWQFGKTLLWFMVDITIVFMGVILVYKPTYNWGGPILYGIGGVPNCSKSSSRIPYRADFYVIQRLGTLVGISGMGNNDVVKTIRNHPQNHHFYRWYKSFPVMGGLWRCLNHITPISGNLQIFPQEINQVQPPIITRPESTGRCSCDTSPMQHLPLKIGSDKNMRNLRKKWPVTVELSENRVLMLCHRFFLSFDCHWGCKHLQKSYTKSSLQNVTAILE